MIAIIICGGDEAGRGALLGPLVIALVAIKKGHERKLVDQGVRDSKLLPRKRRIKLFGTVKRIALDFKVDKITPQEINQAMKNKISLNELEAVHFARLFDQFEIPMHTLYLDSPDVIAEKFGIRVNMSSTKPTRVAGIKSEAVKGIKYTKLVAEHKADSKYPVVSAASIIAKVIRDQEMHNLEKKLGIKLGSGYPSDYHTIKAVKANLQNPELLEHIREHWQTLNTIKQTRLTNFNSLKAKL